MLGDRRLLAELDDGVWVSSKVFGGLDMVLIVDSRGVDIIPGWWDARKELILTRVSRATLLNDIGGSSMVVMLTIQIMACD